MGAAVGDRHREPSANCLCPAGATVYALIVPQWTSALWAHPQPLLSPEQPKCASNKLNFLRLTPSTLLSCTTSFLPARDRAVCLPHLLSSFVPKAPLPWAYRECKTFAPFVILRRPARNNCNKVVPVRLWHIGQLLIYIGVAGCGQCRRRQGDTMLPPK